MLFSALKSRRYRRYWFGSMGTVGASQLMIMAQGWLIFELSGSPMDLGILGAAVSGPAIVVLFFGGILALFSEVVGSYRWSEARLSVRAAPSKALWVFRRRAEG